MDSFEPLQKHKDWVIEGSHSKSKLKQGCSVEFIGIDREYRANYETYKYPEWLRPGSKGTFAEEGASDPPVMIRWENGQTFWVFHKDIKVMTPQYICSECSKEFNSPTSLKRHRRDHSRPPTPPKFQNSARDGPRPPERHLFDEGKIAGFQNWESQADMSIGPGLSNLGNSCFMNATLQTIAYTPHFAQMLLKGLCPNATRRTRDFSLFYELSELVRRMSTGRYAITPSDIFNNLPGISNQKLKCGKQEDAHEFFTSVISTLQEQALATHPTDMRGEPNSAVRDTTCIDKIWGGHVRSQVQCLSCNKTSNSYQFMHDLSLEINGDKPTVLSCLKEFTRKEKQADENMYFCEKCNTKRDAIKRLSVHNAPNVLVLHLKRFATSRYSMGGSKIHKHVSFATELDLDPYTSHPTGNNKYTLFGVLVHSGFSARSGHYYSFVKAPDGSWNCMNDSSVSSATEDYVLGQKAYMLCYTRNATSQSPSRSNQILSNQTPRETEEAKDDTEAENTTSDMASPMSECSDSPITMMEGHQETPDLPVTGHQPVVVFNIGDQVKVNDTFNLEVGHGTLCTITDILPSGQLAIRNDTGARFHIDPSKVVPNLVPGDIVEVVEDLDRYPSGMFRKGTIGTITTITSTITWVMFQGQTTETTLYSEHVSKLRRLQNPGHISGHYSAKVTNATKFNRVNRSVGGEQFKIRVDGEIVCQYLISQSGDEVTMMNPQSQGSVRWTRLGSDASVLKFKDQNFPGMTVSIARALFQPATIKPNGIIELSNGLTLTPIPSARKPLSKPGGKEAGSVASSTSDASTGKGEPEKPEVSAEESIIEDIMNITGCKSSRAHELLKYCSKLTSDKSRLVELCMDRYYHESESPMKNNPMELDTDRYGSSSLTGNKRHMGNRSPDTMASKPLDILGGRWRDTRTPLRSLDLEETGMGGYRSTSSGGLARNLDDWQRSKGTGGGRSQRRSLTGVGSSSYPTSYNGRTMGTRTSSNRYDAHSYMNKERGILRTMLGDDYSG